MKDHSPLIPSGSALEQLQRRKTKVLSTVFVIVAAHVLPITGLLLMQGCKPDSNAVASNDNKDNNTEPLGNEDSEENNPVDDKELYGEFVSNHEALSMPIKNADNSGVAIKEDPSSQVAPNTSNDLDTKITSDWVIKDQAGNPQGSGATPISNDPLTNIETVTHQSKPSETGLKEHEIQPGDVLSRIAKRYKTTLKDLLEANPGVDPRRLKVGYKLVVPSGTALLAKKSEPAKTQVSSTSGKTYEVKAGDSLSAIARAHGVSLNNLRNANNIRTHIIHPGQKLQIPIKSIASGK
jgi:LysM repeat protein